ncbi:transcription elongation factor GreB [Methylomonas sp. SURF-2]|uniref:Transcription elongation factor GreB n=1 Tax=Methylomonas subterranea TaxID=2952225 RepID=A0ABT1TK35_9GAMM|nr:transcription elongation factor GreB [Methylomonas sp. SURF-2]MCQ8105571.1 transcription elongation factor GreB [Methylomonas sp. SURF-2]
MSRWRPPRPKSSPYITQAGYKTLEKELAQLWDRRKHVTAALAAAAAEGDRSENAEYIYRKKELREIDRRIHYLQKRLPALTVVAEKPADRNRVFFGAWVTLENEDGEEITYRIVGADEIDSSGGLISLDSPLAQALLKKNLDDEVMFNQGDRQSRYYIVGIAY